MGNVIGVTLATDGLFSRCFDYAVGRVKLGRNLEENVETLRKEFDVLMAKKKDVHNRVLREEGPEKKRLHQVEDWLSKVTTLEVEIADLIRNSTEEIHKTRRIECCAKSSKSRRMLEKGVVHKLSQVADLKSRGEFPSVVCDLGINPLATRNSVSTVGLKSSIDEVLGYINDDQVGIIGLYGMGGVGKTTLLTTINNKLSDGTHGIDVIIWVRVSDNSNIIVNIQNEIGRKVGYSSTWANKSQVEKADDIFKVLSRTRFVLLLDDIRVEFDLKVVGVPLSNTQNTSKVIFTTRSLEVCGQMQSEREVKVKCLEMAEAWELFKSIVGDRTLKCHPDILKLAELVAKECGGLPLALVIIGKAMASKRTPQEWSRELWVLKMNAAQFTGLEDKVFSLLRLSYDNLSTDTARKCFLYCSLFPGDFHIPKKKLINYWFGEGFVEDPNVCDKTIGDNLEGYYIIGTLVNASLLEDDENGGVKMHDVIRDMALWLACDCGKTTGKYLVQARAELSEVPSGICNEGAERISLASNFIKSLPQVSLCHNLLTLLLNDNLLNVISQGFFESMRGLRVLDLSGNEGITKLPVDISLLVSIQYLNLAGTGISELQEELGGLIRLKYLDLTYTIKLCTIPQGLLSSLKSLRVLKMFGCHSSSFLKETQSLSVGGNLMLLSLTIRSTHFAQRYQNIIRMSARFCIYRLEFSHMEFTPELLYSTNRAKTERLEITDCGFNTRLDMYSGDRYCWNLRSVFIVRCSNMGNLTWLSFAKSLKFLLVAHCEDIQEIATGKDYFYRFDSLEEMYLIELPELRSITSEDILELQKLHSVSPPKGNFPNLRYIGVEGCPKLTNVSVNSDTAVTIQGSEDWWDGLTDKPTAFACITDSKENDKKNYESSASASAASTSTSVSAPTSTSYTEFPHKGKLEERYESSAPVSTSTSHPDSYLPYFISFD